MQGPWQQPTIPLGRYTTVTRSSVAGSNDGSHRVPVVVSQPHESQDSRGQPPKHSPPVIEVLWRPGCSYCSALRRELDRRGVPARWRNIWQDDAARSLVRAANNGNETVPTVLIGDRTLTNPRWQQLAPLLGEGPWLDPTAKRTSGRTRRFLSWLPVVALVTLSFALDAAGHTAASWAVDPFAVAAWWLTRPLRR